jgi:hypothetical protein
MRNSIGTIVRISRGLKICPAHSLAGSLHPTVPISSAETCILPRPDSTRQHFKVQTKYSLTRVDRFAAMSWPGLGRRLAGVYAVDRSRLGVKAGRAIVVPVLGPMLRPWVAPRPIMATYLRNLT